MVARTSLGSHSEVFSYQEMAKNISVLFVSIGNNQMRTFRLFRLRIV